jgi:hypothetical protein
VRSRDNANLTTELTEEERRRRRGEEEEESCQILVNKTAGNER